MSGLWILGLIHIFILLLTFLKRRNKNALKGNNANGLNVRHVLMSVKLLISEKEQFTVKEFVLKNNKVSHEG